VAKNFGGGGATGGAQGSKIKSAGYMNSMGPRLTAKGILPFHGASKVLKWHFSRISNVMRMGASYISPCMG